MYIIDETEGWEDGNQWRLTSRSDENQITTELTIYNQEPRINFGFRELLHLHSAVGEHIHRIILTRLETLEMEQGELLAEYNEKHEYE